MSNYRVGQLCVYARALHGAHHFVGEVVQITEVGTTLAGRAITPRLCDVKIRHHKSGTEGWCNSWQLEPLTPSGAAPSELSYTELMDRLKAGEVECV